MWRRGNWTLVIVDVQSGCERATKRLIPCLAFEHKLGLHQLGSDDKYSADGTSYSYDHNAHDKENPRSLL